MQKVPWWKRNVRVDYLALKFYECMAQTSFFTNQLFDKYILQAKSVHFNYHENETSTPIDIGRIGFYDNKPNSFGPMKYVFFCIYFWPIKNYNFTL